MSRLTVLLARLIGLYCLIVALALAVHKQASVSTVDALVHAPDMLLVIGITTLTLGLAMVLQHNIWSGGAATVIVTIIGWLMLLRAAVFLFLPLDAIPALVELLQFEQLFYAYMALAAALGLYLTYAGFTAPLPPKQ
jgi:putative exporter of polyketide antibiotics